MWTLLQSIVIWYGVVGAITAGVYAWDKLAATRGRRRCPESTLHLLALGGGWVGALIAQQVFRHKRAKAKFVTITWLIAGVHLGAIAMYCWLRWG